MVSLFDHGSAPAGSQFLDGSPGIKVGLTFNFSSAGQVTELWWYCGAQVGGTWTFTVWDITTGDSGGTGAGTQLATQAFVGTPSANAWNKVTLSSAISVSGGNKRYRVAIHNGQYYWVNNNFFDAHDEVNGPISALRDGDTSSPLGLINQGTFTVSSSTTSYPQSTGSKANYAVDVTFVASGADAAAALTLPALTEAAAATVTASGSSSLTLPALTIAAAGAATASGASALTLPHLTISADGTAGVFGTAALTLPALTAAAAGAATAAGASALTLPHLTIAAAGGTGVLADAALTLPRLTGAGAATVTAAAGRSRGWGSLTGVINGQRADLAAYRETLRNPAECPIHLGVKLDQNSAGVLHCTFGGHIVPRG